MISISVVINCYKEGNLILDALQSIENQSDRDFEIIIINDNSPEPVTNNICNEIEQSHRAKVIRNKTNLGHGLSRNVAFEYVRTDVIVFLDADDVMPYDSVSNIRRSFNEHSDADYVFGNYYLRHVEDKKIELIDCSVIADTNGLLSPLKLANNWKLLGTSPCKKSIWEKVKGYRPEFSNTTNDVDFWQRAILKGAKGYFLNETIYTYNQSINGLNYSRAFHAALKKCNYENFDFILFYNDNYKDAFSLALSNKDYKKIKKWALYQKNTKKNKSILVLGFSILPTITFPIIILGYHTIKKLKKN